VLERFLQLSGALGVQTHQPFEGLAQAGQLHGEMQPVEPMLRVGTQVALELARTLLAIREEHELLVVLQTLAPEHLSQVSPAASDRGCEQAEALGGLVRWNRLTHDRDEVGLLALPMP
jgi:hypothetical protein